MADEEEYDLLKPNYPEVDVFQFENPEMALIEYKVPKNRQIRVYSDGVYDLFHFGHARALMQAKNLFPNTYLMVGVSSDKDTLEYKGKLVCNYGERVESVRHCKYVDEVIFDAPWVLNKEFIAKHKIDFVAHDDLPYKVDNVQDCYGFLKEENRFVPTKRTDGISTTGLITRIVKDYDEYVRRSLNRGITAQELNISKLTEQKIKVEGIVQKEVTDIFDELRMVTRFWEMKSSELRARFVEQFSKRRVVWQKIKNVLKKVKRGK